MKIQWIFLLLLMLGYGCGELGHYLLAVTSRSIAQDIQFGDEGCLNNGSITGSQQCSEIQNQTRCINNGTSQCTWDYTGQGLQYQILAGPAYVVIFSIMGIVFGVLGDRYNRTHLIIASTVFFSLMTFATGFSQEYWQLLLLRFAFGAGESACTPLASSVIADWFPYKLRGQGMGIYNWGIYFGYGLAFAVGNYVTDANILGTGWRSCYVITGIAGFIAAILILLFVFEPVRHSTRETPTDKESRVRKNLHQVLAYSCNSLTVPLLLIGACFRHSASFCWSYNAQLYFDDYYPGTEVGFFMSLTSIAGGTIGIITGGICSDVLARKYGMTTRMWVLVISQAIASPFAACVLFVKPPECFISLLLAYTFAEMWFGVLFTILVEFYPQHARSTAVACFLFVINNIGGNAQLIVPPLADVMGFREALYLVYPGFYLTSSVFFFLAQLTIILRKSEPRDDSVEETRL